MPGHQFADLGGDIRRARPVCIDHCTVNEARNLAHVGFAHALRRDRWRPDPDPRAHRRWLGIVGNRVLVQGDPSGVGRHGRVAGGRVRRPGPPGEGGRRFRRVPVLRTVRAGESSGRSRARRRGRQQARRVSTGRGCRQSKSRFGRPAIGPELSDRRVPSAPVRRRHETNRRVRRSLTVRADRRDGPAAPAFPACRKAATIGRVGRRQTLFPGEGRRRSAVAHRPTTARLRSEPRSSRP